MRFSAKAVLLVLLPIAAAFAGTSKIVVMDLKNVRCYACMQTVKNALEKVPGVTDTQLDVENKTATVKFDPIKTNPEMLVRVTAKAGFPSSVRK